MSYTSKLEAEVEELRKQLASITERVRIDAVAEAFLVGNHDVREGDYFVHDGYYITQLKYKTSDGKWAYNDAHGSLVEWFRVPSQSDCARLYTVAEVAEIVSKAAKPDQLLRAWVTRFLGAWGNGIDVPPTLKSFIATLKEIVDHP